MVISLIHPSRSRAKKSFTTLMKWILSAEDKFEIILSLDSDDSEKELYRALYMNTDAIIIENTNKSAVDAINNGAKKASGDIFIVVSDDTDCTVGWDSQIKKSVAGKSDWIAKTPDGIQSWIITMPLLDRAYYNRFGYIYHPDYAHMFCDTELTCVADLTGRKITLDIPFTHNHYSTGRSQKDEVSIKADKTWDQGQALFIERAKRNFDLKEVKSKIMSPDYINWMRSKGIKF